jgi:acyl-CoA thioesterase I
MYVLTQSLHSIFQLRPTQLFKVLVYILSSSSLWLACQSQIESQTKTLGQTLQETKQETKQKDKTSDTKDTQVNTPRLPQKWLFVGDSLTAGYGVSPDEAYVAHVATSLKNQGIQVKGAGVSGDTSAGVVRRIDWLMQQNPSHVFVAIGANDGLRGQSIDQLQANLIAIVDKIEKKGAQVILIGMKLPPNYGKEYVRDFALTYEKVARQKNLKLLPFLLKGVAGHSQLNLADGIHPNAEGHRNVAKHVIKFIKNNDFFRSN